MTDPQSPRSGGKEFPAGPGVLPKSSDKVVIAKVFFSDLMR